MKIKPLILIILIQLLATSLRAQEAQNIADLDFLYHSIRKLPSYKDQLKNDQSYRQLYESLRLNLKSNDEFEVYQKFLQLIYLIKDNHLGFWRKPDSTIRFQYLKSENDIIALQSKYENYPLDSLEGIYEPANGDERLVLFQQMKNVYHILNLKTQMVEVILNKLGDQGLDAIRFLNPPVPYVLYRNVKHINGKLSGLNYRKVFAKEYAPIDFHKNKYQYTELEKEIGYLRLSSFSSSNENIKVATDFFNKVKPTINKRYLIVDLRNNGGGGNKTSKQFYTFLKKYKGKIFLLQNSNTVSNAEQFILDLRGLKKLTTLGEITRGTLTYGSNYGKTIELPSHRFLFYPTDMKGRAKDLPFENIGIKPDISLDAFGDNWIKQTVDYIKEN
jgi:hypothetical protein